MKRSWPSWTLNFKRRLKKTMQLRWIASWPMISCWSRVAARLTLEPINSRRHVANSESTSIKRIPTGASGSGEIPRSLPLCFGPKAQRRGNRSTTSCGCSDTYVRTATGWRYAFAQASLPLPKENAMTGEAERSQYCCPIVELRQYTLHPGKRDAFIDLFERQFIESQEAVGTRMIGQFRDLDDP